MKKSVKITMFITLAIILGVIILINIPVSESLDSRAKSVIREVKTTIDTTAFDDKINYLVSVMDSVSDSVVMTDISYILDNTDYLKEMATMRFNEWQIENIKEIVSKQFDTWGGVHIKLKEYIKTQMNDPNSFEHLGTRHSIEGDFVMVYTEFTGKNAFGGRVRHSVIAKCWAYGGDIVEIVQFE
jgi:hypothetical protein